MILLTGAAGNAGVAVATALLANGMDVRLADVMPSPQFAAMRDRQGKSPEFVRCDSRTPADVRRAIEGCEAVIHLAAWHCAHKPPVSDETIFAVNVDGTFNVLQVGREAGVKAVVYASSMAYGWGSVYGVTKVIGEGLVRSFQEMTGASMISLRYHEFIPCRYLDYGPKLLRNGVDRQDVARATVAAVRAALQKKFTRMMTIVHTSHGMPRDVVNDFRTLGPDWCEAQVPGATKLIEKYRLPLPQRVEQHDLSEAKMVLGWTPEVGFVEFLRDLSARDARGEDVSSIIVPGELPAS